MKIRFLSRRQSIAVQICLLLQYIMNNLHVLRDFGDSMAIDLNFLPDHALLLPVILNTTFKMYKMIIKIARQHFTKRLPASTYLGIWNFYSHCFTSNIVSILVVPTVQQELLYSKTCVANECKVLMNSFDDGVQLYEQTS